MRSWFSCVAAAVVLALVGPSVAGAQHPHTRNRFWVSAGAGLAMRTYSCDGCDTLPDQSKGLAPTFRIRFGGAFTSQLMLAMQLDGWVKSGSGTTAAAWLLSPAIYYYPSEQGGSFFGIGLGHLGFVSDDGIDKIVSNGFGFLITLGRDYRFKPRVSVTPVINILTGGFGSLNLNEVRVGRYYKQAVIELGVGITFH